MAEASFLKPDTESLSYTQGELLLQFIKLFRLDIQSLYGGMYTIEIYR